MMRISRLTMLWLLLLVSMPASAEVRAWLSRDRVGADETVTLNIETDQADASSPDYDPLSKTFEVSGHTSSRRYESVNGVMRTQILFAVALRPLRGGMLEIPALSVGKQQTKPLRLEVSPQTSKPARAGDTAFIEIEADTTAPYVQQAVGYIVRLYFATRLISGQLDQDSPEGASLQQVGEDVQYQRDLAGKRYTVIERRYLLIPERSGAITIPGARFRGQATGNFFDDLFGDGRRDLSARGATQTMQVRPMPPNAPQPWLPLRAMSLQYLTTPRSARVGEAALVTVEARADGINATQLPELQFPVPDGAQVFADPPQVQEDLQNGRPQVRLVQRFSVVPARAGRLRIAGPQLPWWDVRSGAAQTAALPELVIEVAPGAGGAGAGSRPASTPQSLPTQQAWIRLPFVQEAIHPWALGTVIFALLWLVTLGWALQRRTHASGATTAHGAPPAQPVASAAAPRGSADLRIALQQGDLGRIAAALCAGADRDLDAVRTRLADPQQANAVAALQQARWGAGDAGQALAQLRAAFASGPVWRPTARAEPAILPPLYPQRGSQPTSSPPRATR